MHRTLVNLMKSGAITLLLSLALCPSLAQGQTRGIFSVGGSVTFVSPTDDDVSSTVTFAPLVRLNPKKGWGPAGALNWFRTDIQNSAGGDDPFARLRVRPLMAGVGYTVGNERNRITFSIVGGPSFNKVDFEDDFVNSLSSRPTIDAENSVAIRPGISLTRTLAERVALTGFAGYMFNRPDITYRNVAGQEFSDRWKADSVVLSVGLVYSLF